MYKHLFSLLFAVLFTTAGYSQGSFVYGYPAEGITLEDTLVSGEIKTAVISGYKSSKYRTPHYGLLEMTEKVSSSFSNAQITSICFCPFITSVDSASIVISEEIGGKPLYEQRCAVKSHEWSNVELKTPFQILDGQHLYIGYKIDCLDDNWPIGYYYTSNVMPQSATVDPVLDYVAYEKTDGTIMSGLLDTQTWTARRQTANLMLYATIEGDLVTDAISLDNISLTKGQYVKPNSTQMLSTTITNVGTNSINQFYLKVDMDGETKMEQNVTQFLLQPMEEKTFYMNLPTDVSDLHKVSVTIDYPNGMDNQYTGINNKTKEYLVYNDSVKKSVLIEHFTSAKCVNCIGGDTILANYIGSAKAKCPDLNVIRINHHSGFEADAMTTQDDIEYEWFYGGTMWAPANMTDRRDFSDYGAKGYGGTASVGPVHGASGTKLDSMIVIADRTASFITLTVTPSMDSNRLLTVKVNGTCLYDLPEQSEKRLNVALVENGIVYPQLDENNNPITDYVHDYVYRGSLTGTWGEADVIEDKTIDKTYTFTIPTGWKAENMKVVAFISNYDPTNNKNCQVEQTVEAPIITEGIESIFDNDEVSSNSYNVMGQRVNDTQKGLIIRNGKKYLVK